MPLNKRTNKQGHEPSRLRCKNAVTVSTDNVRTSNQSSMKNVEKSWGNIIVRRFLQAISFNTQRSHEVKELLKL